MRIYIACLASYNNGVLHGRWVDASSDVEKMQGEIAAMLRASRFPNVMVTCPTCEGELKLCSECGGGDRKVPSAEEWAMHDSEGLPRCFGEYPSLEKIAEFVELVEEFDHIDAEDVAAIVDNFGGIEEAGNQMRDNFAGVYETFRDYAEEVADEALHGLADDHILVRYFDYDSYARDLRMDLTTVDISTGIAIFYP